MFKHIMKCAVVLGTTAILISSSGEGTTIDKRFCITPLLYEKAPTTIIVPKKYFEDWVKPTKEGYIPVYTSNKLDYISYDEFDWMVKLIYREAGNQSWECQVAIAEVLLNRLEHDAFEVASMTEVIFSPGQFSPVSSESIYTAEETTAIQEAVAYVLEVERTLPNNVVYFDSLGGVNGIYYTAIDDMTFSYTNK